MTRDEAISVLKETIDPNVDKSFKEWKEWDKEKHLPAVNMAIEALQAEPVVRCKECKNAGRKMGTHYHCEQQMSWHEEEYFCSYGERREP